MTGLFSAQRRADEFEALLSRGSDAPLTDREAERFADLVSLVSDLRTAPAAMPRPEFAGSLRERLMVEADTVLLPQPARTPAAPQRLTMPARGRDRRLAALLGGVAMVGATATMAVAAQTALPGESLYPVKRGIEAAELRFAGDDTSRGRTLLANAETRLTELEALTARDDRSVQQTVPDTLDAFTEQSGEGVRRLLTAYAQSGSEADVERAREFTATSLGRLGALAGQVPESARDELLFAGRTLTDLDLEAGIACPACGGGITTTPEFLLTTAPIDLTAGLDIDDMTLEAAPVSGQDLTGISVPEGLLPDAQPTSQTTPTTIPTTIPTSIPTVTPTPTTTPTTQVEQPVKDATKGVKDPVKDPVKDLTGPVTDTTGGVTQTLDGVTGGAVGGLTGGVDNATGGLIGEVTGTLDQVTGGTVTGLTGGLLP